MLPFKTIKIMVLCLDPLVQAGITATLQTQPDMELLASPAESAVSRPAAPCDADLVVADYEHGLALVDRTFSTAPLSRRGLPKVLIVTRRSSEQEIRHALERGVRGYLIQGCSLEALLEAVREIHRGVRYVDAVAARRMADSMACTSLTCRETEVMRLVVEGLGNKAIARRLEIAIGTVKSHLKTIFEKLDAKSRTEAAAVVERRGLLTLSVRDDGSRPLASPLHRQVVARLNHPHHGTPMH